MSSGSSPVSGIDNSKTIPAAILVLALAWLSAMQLFSRMAVKFLYTQKDSTEAQLSLSTSFSILNSLLSQRRKTATKVLIKGVTA